MLIYSMSVSVDGFIADREGAFEWTPPSDELFRFHTALVSELARWRHALPAAGHRRRSAKPSRDQDVRLARDRRALPARPR